MRALQIQRFGEPVAALKLVDIEQAPLREGEVRVRVRAAGISPSDVANAKGAFPNATLPRVIGRDFAGEIVQGPPELIGLEVWGSGGDLGFTRDGTHAEMIDIPREAVSQKPQNLSMEEDAVVGVPFTAAHMAIEGTRLKGGDWVIVTGAAGAVGSAAIELIHARGGFVISLVKDEHEASMLNRAKVQAVAKSESGDLAEVVRQATNGKGADVALNGLGAATGLDLLASLGMGGRMAVYGTAITGREMQLDLFTFYRKSLELFGVNTGNVAATKAAVILNELRPLFENGSLDQPRIVERFSLDQFAAAYDKVRAATGKVVFSLF